MFGLNTADVSTIVLTSLTSALISGVVVYLIQKSIENTFTKRMDEFRANLELSIFQQQTKFSKNYQKSTETILTFHEKLVAIRNDFDSYIKLYTKIVGTQKLSKNKSLLEKQIDKLYKGSSDLTQFAGKYSIHLSQELSMKIDELTYKVAYLVFHLSASEITKEKPEAIKHLVGLNKILKIDITESAFQNTSDLHQQIKANIDQLISELESLYRGITA